MRTELINVSSVVASIVSLLRHLVGPRVELSVDLTPQLPQVLANTGQVMGLMVDLATNARSVLPLGGRLTIGSHLQVVDGQRCDVNLPPPGSYVILTVVSSGPQTDATSHDSIAGASTLGEIMNHWTGHFRMTGEPGRSTTFEFYFLPQPPGQ